MRSSASFSVCSPARLTPTMSACGGWLPGGQRRRGCGPNWVRALSTAQLAPLNSLACGRRGRARGFRTGARGQYSCAARPSPRPASAAHRPGGVAGHHCCSGVSCSTGHSGRAGSRLPAVTAPELGPIITEARRCWSLSSPSPFWIGPTAASSPRANRARICSMSPRATTAPSRRRSSSACTARRDGRPSK